MDTSFRPAAPVPARRLPAWAFSVLFHLAWISILAVVVERSPRGAAEAPGRTAGIVLKSVSAEGDVYEDQHDLAHQAAPDEGHASDLLAALPGDAISREVGADLPQLPAAERGAASGGDPGDGQLASGGGQRGSLGGGSTTRVSLFGVEGTGTKFVYVIDRSGSMAGAPLAAAKRQLIESLESLESIHQFQVIFFNHQLHVMDITAGGGRIPFASDRNKQLAANFVGGITADGGTERLPALLRALAMQPDVIFFLTDSDDRMSPGALADIRRANRRAAATICVIDFGFRATPPPQSDSLKELAQQHGGQYVYIDATALEH